MWFSVECLILLWFKQKTDDWRWDFCFVILRGAISSVAGTFKLLSFITFLFVLQIKIHLDLPYKMWFSVECVIFIWFKKKQTMKVRFVFCDSPRCNVKCLWYIQAFILHIIFICASNQNPPRLTIENLIFCWMSNFYLIQAENRWLKGRFLFCDSPRCYVKCCRYIQAFILHNIFICSSNHNPHGLTIENVIFCWMFNFYLIQTKNRWLKVRFLFCDSPRYDIKCRRYIQAFILHNILFVLQIKIHLDLPYKMWFSVECVIFIWFKKTQTMKVRFVFCDSQRCDVKCLWYVQAFILHIIFICASNQNPPRLTIENLIFFECVTFIWFKQKTDDWRWDLCFMILRGTISSVRGTFKLLSYITFLFVLQIKIHLDWPLKMWYSVQCFILVRFKQKTDDWRWDLCFVNFRGAMSSVAATFKLLSFITFLFVLQIKIHLDWP